VIRRGPLVVALAGIGVVVLIVVALILPKASQVKARQADVAKAKTEQKSLELQLQQLQADAKDSRVDRKQLAKLERQVPPTTDLPGLINVLNTVADKSGVDWVSVAPGQPSLDPNGSASVIPTQIIVNGGFFAVDQYLFRLEQLTRASKVTSISVSPDATGTVLTVTMTVEFYTTDVSAGPGSVPGSQTASGTGTGSTSGTAPAASPSPSAGGGS
jgi:Tfp pilus assembly protein PilO